MNSYRRRLSAALLAAAIIGAPIAPIAADATPAAASVPAAADALTVRAHLPLVMRPVVSVCPQTSGNNYAQGPVYQYDGDNPVRPAWNHADKNISLRGYAEHVGTSLNFKQAGVESPQPPQFATLFNPSRVPNFTKGYRVYQWNWQSSPSPGTPGAIYTGWLITVIGMQTAAGEALRVPASGYDIGAGMEVVVMFADADTVALHYTREDSASRGYTVHLDNICTDPNLLTLYNSLEGARNLWYGGDSGGTDYDLVTLTSGQVFGTARDTEIRAAIVDSGGFMDPMFCTDWWQGYC